MFEYPPDPYKPLPKVACRLLSFLMSESFSFFGTGGGGNGPAGGAGRMGRVVVVKLAALALDEPLAETWSGALSVVTLGMEFVVEVRGGRPGWLGWKVAPDARTRLLAPFLIGDRASLYCGEVTAERMSPPPMGMSPDVGVGKEYCGE